MEQPPQTPIDDLPCAEVSLDVAADPARVWRAVTTEQGLAPWMGEGATIDPQPAGLVVLPDLVGGVTRRGRVERVDEGRRLDFTWWPALRPAEQTLVSITVTPLDDGTRIRVAERPVERTVVRARSPQSWAAAGRVSRNVIGAWSWRLALVSLSCALSPV